MVEASQIYDLLIRNGRVVDPASGVDGVVDVAVRDGRIAKVAPGIAPGSAKETVDATGRLVIPGMIDTHAHVFEHVSGRFGLNPDLVGVRSGVTTVIDQGGPSCMTFPAFRKFIAEPADTRVLAFVSIYVVGGLEGHYYPALYGPSGIDVAACVRTAAANADLVKGIKGHAEPGGIARWGLGSLELASQAARETGLPLYIHLGQLWPPPDDAPEVDMDEMLPRIVELMDEGDILAHPFTRHPGGFVDRTGKVHPVVREALARGLRIDVGHGSHFSFDMARRVLDAGILPYTLGADLHGYNVKIPTEPGTPDSHPDDEMHLFAGDTQFSLCRAMTELLALGVKLEDIVPMVTSHCAAMIGMESELGSLAPGMPADISVLRDETGEWKLSDNGGVTVTASRRVAPVLCVKAGTVYQADAPILPH